VFAKKMNMDLEKAIAELEGRGIAFETERDTLEQIAKRNKTSPMLIYRMIKQYEEKPLVVKGQNYTPEMVEEQFAGMGIGQKTLKVVCAEIGMDIAQAKGRIAKQDILIKEDEALKKVAERHGVTPLDILKIILVKDFKLPKT
jgi:Holliday junction resolvasome RuvABC ATP-dependent DNA helicase subunit